MAKLIDCQMYSPYFKLSNTKYKNVKIAKLRILRENLITLCISTVLLAIIAIYGFLIRE